jgi:uncharacterized protein YdcH (DUF465 family)
MFEYEQDLVDHLLATDDHFKHLYEKHRALKEKVHDANLGALPLMDIELEKLKKQKLQLKDEMASMIQRCRSERASA